jgi:hypothetical protein
MSAQKQPTQDLVYAMKSTKDQVTEQVDKVCAVNKRTEEQLQSLINRVGDIKVSLTACHPRCVSYFIQRL